MIFVVSAYVKVLFDRMSIVFTHTITKREMENFILKSRDAADQLERASYTAFSYLEKYKAIIETILDPRFINGTEYPTNWADVPYYNFTTLPESQKTGNRSYSQITYSAPGEVTSSTHDFIKKMSSLNE